MAPQLPPLDEAPPCSPFCLGPSCDCWTSGGLHGFRSAVSALGGLKGDEGVQASLLPHSRHVFLCFKQPHEWPSSPFFFEWGSMPRALRTAVQGTEAVAPLKPLMTVCEGRDNGQAGQYNGNVLLFPDMLLFRAMTRFDIQCFVEEALMQPSGQPGRGDLRPEPLTGCHIFVCSQSTAGTSCGTTGPRVAARLNAELAKRNMSDTQVKVWRCCHLVTGSIQCQGNIVVFGSVARGASSPFPSNSPGKHGRCSKGEWYSGVTPADVEDLVESHILGGEVVKRLWVGSMASGQGSEQRRKQHRLSLDLVKPGTPIDAGFLQAPAFIGEVMDCAPQDGGTQFDREMTALHWRHLYGASQRHRHGPHRSAETPTLGPGTVSLHPHMSKTSHLEPLRSTLSCPDEHPQAPYLGQGQRPVSNSTSTESRGGGGSNSPHQVGRGKPSWGSPSALTRANLSGNTVSQASSPGLEGSEHLLRPAAPCPWEAAATAGADQWEVACSARPAEGMGSEMQTENAQSSVRVAEGAGDGGVQVGKDLISVEEWPFPRQSQKGRGRKGSDKVAKPPSLGSSWGRCWAGKAGDWAGGYSLAVAVGCAAAVAAGVCVLVAGARARGGSQRN